MKNHDSKFYINGFDICFTSEEPDCSGFILVAVIHSDQKQFRGPKDLLQFTVTVHPSSKETRAGTQEQELEAADMERHLLTDLLSSLLAWT